MNLQLPLSWLNTSPGLTCWSQIENIIEVRDGKEKLRSLRWLLVSPPGSPFLSFTFPFLPESQKPMWLFLLNYREAHSDYRAFSFSFHLSLDFSLLHFMIFFLIIHVFKVFFVSFFKNFVEQRLEDHEKWTNKTPNALVQQFFFEENSEEEFNSLVQSVLNRVFNIELKQKIFLKG